MKNISIVLTLLFSFYCLPCDLYFIKNFDHKLAKEKRLLLWQEIEKSQYDLENPPSVPSPGIAFLKLLLPPYLKKTFDYNSDLLPLGREKLIHAAGSVAKISFVPIDRSVADLGYTGIYKSGAIGLARFSLAIPDKNGASYTPGIALKFLIDGRESKNIFAMFSLDGQGQNRNPFAHDLTTKINGPSSFILKILSKSFELAKGSDPTILRVDHLADFTARGEKIIDSKGPKSLILKSIQKDIIPENSTDDFRIQLNQLKPFETPLFTVYAQVENEEIAIGFISLDSKFIPSAFGDKNLFFQHAR